MNDKLYPFRSDVEQAEYEVFLSEENDHRNRTYGNRQVTSVSDNLVAFRRRQRLKKAEIARMMGVTPRTYYAYERGKRAIPSDALIKLATETGTDIHQLLMGRPATEDANIIRAALIDAKAISYALKKSHPGMDEPTRLRVANACISTDWGRLPRVHPKAIDAAILQCEQEDFLSSELPSPPDFRDYQGDFQQYETDLARWKTSIGS